ncbi:MAG: response regulator [Pseudomonadota bacterium]
MNLADQFLNERRARLAAERLLELRSRELDEARRLLALASPPAGDTGAPPAATDAVHEARMATRRLWEALETVRDGFAIFDRQLRLVAANRAYLSAFGQGSPIGPGSDLDTILHHVTAHGRIDLEGRDPAAWCAMMRQRLARPVIDPLTVRLGNGRYVRLIDRRSEDGDLVSLALDITDAMTREAELEEARRAAEAATRAKSAFLATMSHEIRTPMNGVVGMAELLCDTELTEDQRLYAETIRGSGEALLAIINSVLDYSRIEAGRLELRPEPFDLEQCLQQIVALLMPEAQEKGLRLLIDYDLFLPSRFIGDPLRIRQVLTNLLGNAVKFTAAGHVLARVVGLECEAGRYELHVTVEDSGIGIAPEHQDLVWGEFNQVESEANRRFEGTGLGLAIARQLVGLMGGSMWLDSAAGEGSCFGFTITLPRAGDPPPPPAVLPVTVRRALVVDDQLVNRQVLERQLASLGIEVTTCGSAVEAQAALAADAGYGVILTDFRMPGPDGLALADDLRRRGIAIPVLLLTSLGGPEPGPGTVAGILHKPVLRSALYRALAELPAAPPRPDPPRRMRVLAAEDNRTNQLVLRKMVEDFAIDLHLAGDGHEAVALWDRLRPDLILMDISMPGLDGRAAARIIRSRETGNDHVPIIALTAHAVEGDGAEILGDGIDGFQTKPLRKQMIAQLLDRHRPAGTLPPRPEGRDG